MVQDSAFGAPWAAWASRVVMKISSTKATPRRKMKEDRETASWSLNRPKEENQTPTTIKDSNPKYPKSTKQ